MSDNPNDVKFARLLVRLFVQAAKIGPEAAALTLIHGSVHLGAHVLGALVTTTSALVPRGNREEKPRR